MYTTILAALEEVTMREEEAVYHRIYSWWVLVQTWCPLRFGDHRRDLTTRSQSGRIGTGGDLEEIDNAWE